MFIVNQGMICRHQFRVLIQSDSMIFHISHIHTRWFNLSSDPPTNSTGFITIVNGERNHTTIPLSYMNQLRTDNVYTPTIREKVNKKIQYGAAISIAKTNIQIAITKDVTAELIEILKQFIMKYRKSTGLSIEKSTISFSDTIYRIVVLRKKSDLIGFDPNPIRQIRIRSIVFDLQFGFGSKKF
jgi:hypothetical protein